MSTESLCVTDCSILNQTTCELMQPKHLYAEQGEIDFNLWDQNGCYNPILFKSTLEYKYYDNVRFCLLFIVFL